MPQPTCEYCGGMHFGSPTGKCVFLCERCTLDVRPDANLRCQCPPLAITPTPKKFNIADELIAAADPFKRVLAINAPFLNAGDDKPLREFIHGVWPTWGEYKRLLTVISMIDEANQRHGKT